MKKLLLACLVCIFAVACNNNAETDKSNTDTIQPDTTNTVSPAPDSAKIDKTINTDTLPVKDTLKK